MEAEKSNNIISLAKMDELVEFLNRLGLKVDKTVIETNDSDTIVELLSTVLEKLGVIKKDRLKMNFKGLEFFAYPGLHDRPIYILKLYKLSKRFISDVLRVDNYTLGDLLNPTPKRSKKILSKILAFYRFKQEYNPLYNSQLNKMNEYTYKLNEDNNRQEKLKQNLEGLKKERQYDKNNINIMQDEILKTKGQIEQLEMENKDTKEKVKELSDQITEFDEKAVK
jgi:hypothetical protein